MSLPVATTISGIDTMEVLEPNLQVAVNFQPLSAAEMQGLRDRSRYFASDGRFEFIQDDDQIRWQSRTPAASLPDGAGTLSINFELRCPKVQPENSWRRGQ